MLTSDLFENKTPAAWRAGYERGLKYYRQGPDNPYPAGSEEAKDYADGYHNGELDSYDKYDTSTMNEGAVKELSQDLRSISDAEFLARYKMTKTQARAEMKSGVAESYPKYQDLSGISTDKLEAYLAKQSRQQVPGEGNQVKRVQAELQRRQQGLAEVSKATLDRYVEKAVDAHGHADFAARQSKDDPTLRSYHKSQAQTAKKRRQGISRALDRMSKTEGVAESVPMDDAVKVLRQYGADHVKTTSNELHFYKKGQIMSIDLIFNDDATRSVSLSQLNSATRRLKGQGVAEGSLNEFAPGAGGDDDIGDDPYKYPKPKRYNRSADYFGQFEADHFDREDFDDATGVFKGYWGKNQIAYFKFDNPARTGGDDSGMGWYYEPESSSSSDDTNAAPDVDRSEERKQQELSMINAFLKSGNRPNPDSQIGRLMKKHGLAESYRDRRDAYQRDQYNAKYGMDKRQSRAYSADGGANDERHDLDPTDWYVVKDGKMFAISVYPRQEQEAMSLGYSRTKQEARAKSSEQGVTEGLPQTLRKFVPGYAKREIDKKMDAQKFGKDDVAKDANYYRYKKIQDKLKEQGVAEGQLGNVLQWPEVVNKINSAMKATGWKGQRQSDDAFMYSTKGQETDDQWYIVMISNAGEGYFSYALGTVEDGDPYIDDDAYRGKLPNTEASVSELINDIRDGFGLNEGVAEARRNSEQNPKPESGMIELASIAKTINDPENWAISMTSEPKLGINPQVGISEDTPKGIYFYPLNYALDKTRYGKLPWGDNYPYIQLFQYDRSREMTKETQVDPARLKQALLQYCPEEIIQQASEEGDYDGTPYWTIYDCLSRLGQSDETNIVRWNKVLRDLGFTSVFDNGAGWIAHNEPTQGVVLDPRVIKQHKTITNKQKSKLVTPAVIERAIFETMDMELASNRAWQAYDPDGSKLRAAAKEYAKKPEFKQYYGKPGTEEIFDKAEGMGRYGARELSHESWEWYQAQKATKEGVAEGAFDNYSPMAQQQIAKDKNQALKNTSADEVIRDLIQGSLDGYDVMAHPRTPAQKVVAKMMQEKYDDIAINHRLHPDDDFEEIISRVIDDFEEDYGPGLTEEQDLAEAVSTLELADFLFKGIEQKFPKIIERYGHEVVGNAIMDVAEENLDVSSVSEVDMLIDDIIEKLQNYNGNDSGLKESTVSRLYYNVVGTSAPELRKDFGMRHDRCGWFLSESSGRNRIMDAQRAFGSPKLVEYSVSDATSGAAQLGPDNVISPVGSVPKSQRINTKKARK